MRLDFGAYAKGYAVDRGVEALRALGIKNAILNAGGDLRAYGARGVRPWRIGIRHPRAPAVFASIEIETDESILTSGDYERFFIYNRKRYHHVIDPRTGFDFVARLASLSYVFTADGSQATVISRLACRTVLRFRS